MLPAKALLMRRAAITLTTPADLFTGGVNGSWWDPSDLSSLWKDTAGTSPVTTDGDLVARVDDKSGNGRHLLQGTAINRPKFKDVSGHRYLLMDDSTGDWMVMFAPLVTPFGSTWSRVSAFNSQGGTAGTANGHLYSDGGVGSSHISLYADGLGLALTTAVASGPRVPYSLNSDMVVTELWHSSPSEIALDNGAYVTSPAMAGVGPRGFGLGMRYDTGTDHMKAKWHGATMIDRALTGTEIAFLRTYYGAKQGRTL